MRERKNFFDERNFFLIITKSILTLFKTFFRPLLLLCRLIFFASNHPWPVRDALVRLQFSCSSKRIDSHTQHTHLHTQTHTHTPSHTRTHTHAHKRTQTHRHTHAHIHTNAYPHKHKHSLSLKHTLYSHTRRNTHYLCFILCESNKV